MVIAPFRILRLTAVLLLALVCGAISENPLPAPTAVDFGAVEALLDVVDLIAERSGDFERRRDSLDGLDATAKPAFLASCYKRNLNDSELQRAIDHLLSLDAYQLYYRQYRNVTPDHHRELLLHLPLEVLPGPADIGVTLQQLLIHRAEVRAIVESIRQGFDLARSRAAAQEWLPPGVSLPADVYFFYDGNGDAFARDGVIGYDLVGAMFSRRPDSARFAPLTAADARYIELTLAHELHHIGFRQLNPDLSTDVRGRLLRSIVTEGLAMHCQPPTGIRREAMEDTLVVEYWLRQLEGHLGALERGELSAASFAAWRDSTYHALALRQLKSHVARRQGNDRSESPGLINPGDRAAMVYTLGWWMVDRIAGQGENRAAAIALVRQPDSVVVWYNRVVDATAPHLALKL